jgi:hypothetical protein
MLKVIPMLAAPASCGANSADAFDVIVTSLPGYGFSDRPTESGVNTFRIADVWMELMKELGYERLAAQAGDWSADAKYLGWQRKAPSQPSSTPGSGVPSHPSALRGACST